MLTLAWLFCQSQDTHLFSLSLNFLFFLCFSLSDFSSINSIHISLFSLSLKFTPFLTATTPSSCRIQIASSSSFSLPSKGALFHKVLFTKIEAPTSPSLFRVFMQPAYLLSLKMDGIVLYKDTHLGSVLALLTSSSNYSIPFCCHILVCVCVFLLS